MNPKIIRTWSARHGWSKIASDSSMALAQTGEKALAVHLARDMAERSKAIRSNLATVVEDQVNVLLQNPALKVSQLANSPKGQGHAAVAKTIAETASTVFRWKESVAEAGLIALGTGARLRQRDALPPVEAEVVSAE